MAQASKRHIDDVSRSGDTRLIQQHMAHHTPQRSDTRFYGTPKKLKASSNNGHVQNGAAHNPKNNHQETPADMTSIQQNGQRVEI
jgi:hypothetical protein